MIRIEFTSEEIDLLESERYWHPNPRVQRKMEAVYLKSQGIAHQEICRLCRISEPTLVAYLKQYQEGGIERLKKTNIGERLANWINMLRHWRSLFQRTPATHDGTGATNHMELSVVPKSKDFNRLEYSK
jgi:hypothetical protein